MKVLQILYSGMGGQWSVAKTLLDNWQQGEMSMLFYGVEELNPEFSDHCSRQGVDFKYVGKRRGMDKDSWNRVGAIVKENPAELVLLHSSNLILPVYKMCKELNVPLVVIEHTANEAKNWKEHLYSYHSLRKADALVHLSQAYNSGYPWWVRSASPNIHIIPNGIDTEIFKPGTAEHSNTRLGMVSRFSPQKDQASVIDMYGRLLAHWPGLSLDFAGDGEHLQNAKMSVNRLEGSSVKFHGNINEQGVIEMLQSLDIYVQASLQENHSTAILQALSCGLPCVVSNIPGNKAFEGCEAVTLVDTTDITAFSDAVTSLITKPALIEELKIKARSWAKEHGSSNRMLQSYQTLFKSLGG